jgi:hypothetical protein
MAKAKRVRKKAAAKATPELAKVDLPALVSAALDLPEQTDAAIEREPPGLIDAAALSDEESFAADDAAADDAAVDEAAAYEAPAFLQRRRLPDNAFRLDTRATRQADQPRVEIESVAGERRARWLPSTALAATIGIAAACGALAGSLATLGLVWLHPSAMMGTPASGDITQEVARIDAEFAALKANLGAVTTSSVTASGRSDDDRGRRPQSAAGDVTGSIPDAHAMVATPQLPTIEGWVLRNVYGGTAVVEGSPGLIQVMPGDSLPGVGRIETIKRQDGRWVVVTSQGLIVTR